MNQSKKTGKFIINMLAAVLILAIAVGCSAGSNEVFVNKQYADSGMKTIRNSNFDYTNSSIFNEWGVGFSMPQAMQDLGDSGNFTYLGTDYSLFFIYLAESLFAPQNSEKSQEEQMMDFQNSMHQCFTILRIPANDEAAAAELEQVRKIFPYVDLIGESGSDTYYFAYNDDYSALVLSDTDKANIETLLSEREAFINSICLFPAEAKTSAKSSMPSYMNMNSFETKTIDGGTFTQDQLAGYDITMVNIWATWCGPCVDEIPELQKLYNMLPDNVNMITICTDLNDELKLAKQILDETGCTFETLYPSEQLEQSLLKELVGYPTTIFVDSKGNMVGESQLGAPGVGSAVAQAYLRMIEERLEIISDKLGVTTE